MTERLTRIVAAARRTLADPRFVVRAVHLVLVATLLIANVVAAGVTLVLVVFVVPGTGDDVARTVLAGNAWFLLAFLGVVLPLVLAWAWRQMRGLTHWIGLDRPPRPDELRRLLRTPVRVLLLLGGAWSLAALLFAAFNLDDSTALAVRIFLVTGLTGATMAAFGYLVTERLLRPVAAIALQSGGFDRSVLPGITRRQLLGWATATGAPVLGMVLVGALALGDLDGVTRPRLALTMVVLGGVALVFGLVVELLAARAVADPVRTVRKGMERVRRGQLDVRIPVYDASDLGRLQDGFNRMAAGIQDRDRLRDLFGRHVGEEVASSALRHEVRLGGEARDVCALFVDIVGSTTLATRHGPDEVVALLNRFFAVVVQTVGEHRGWVNKFQGDAALVIFGAPMRDPRAPDRALAAARELGVRLAADVPELRAGVGVSGGEAVAGYIGTEERLEYTVIGDPINEAARLTEVAKELPGAVAVAGRLVERASAQEQAHWRLDHHRTLRGRDRTTVVMVPVTGASGTPLPEG
jgi:adenylate cyclase